jgi:hypothetical protein
LLAVRCPQVDDAAAGADQEGWGPSMTASGPDEDDALLEELRSVVRRAGGPTPAMTAAAEAAYSWATVDAELAALTSDSLVDEAVGVRGASAGPRDLVFGTARMSVELEQDADCLLGQLVPPSTGEASLLRPDGELARADVDELGRFRFEGSVTGLVRLRLATSSGVLLTDWVRL